MSISMWVTPSVSITCLYALASAVCVVHRCSRYGPTAPPNAIDTSPPAALTARMSLTMRASLSGVVPPHVGTQPAAEPITNAAVKLRCPVADATWAMVGLGIVTSTYGHDLGDPPVGGWLVGGELVGGRLVVGGALVGGRLVLGGALVGGALVGGRLVLGGALVGGALVGGALVGGLPGPTSDTSSA